MTRINIAANTPYDEMLAFSRVVAIENEAWVSATAPFDDKGNIVGLNDAYAQAHQCLQNIFNALAKVNFRPEDIVRTRIYLRSFQYVNEVAAAHKAAFEHIRPACGVVAISDFVRPEMLVYIEADARRQ